MTYEVTYHVFSARLERVAYPLSIYVPALSGRAFVRRPPDPKILLDVQIILA